MSFIILYPAMVRKRPKQTRLRVMVLLICVLSGLAILMCARYVTMQTVLKDPGTVQKLTVNGITKELGGIPYSESCFVPKAVLKENLCAPQFIIAGTMKGGTTSLYTYLLQHPLVLPLAQSSINLPRGENGKRMRLVAMGDKEIRFFNKHIYNPIVAQYPSQSTLRAYLSFFPEIHADEKHEISYKSGFITGEASPTYLVSQIFDIVRYLLLLLVRRWCGNQNSLLSTSCQIDFSSS